MGRPGRVAGVDRHRPRVVDGVRQYARSAGQGPGGLARGECLGAGCRGTDSGHAGSPPMRLHPASIGELEELLARARQRPRTFVVFIRPGGVAAAWRIRAPLIRRRRSPGHGHPRRRRRRGSAVRRLDLRPDPVVRPGWPAGVCGRHHRLSGEVRQQHRPRGSTRMARRRPPRPYDRSGLWLLVVLVVEAGTESTEGRQWFLNSPE